MKETLLRCHPLIDVDFVKGEGCHLYDVKGRRYTDYESGSWAANLGHGHPAITRALCEQAGRLMHLGVRTPNHLARRLAEQLLTLAGLEGGRCTLLNAGSEAVEFGVQALRRVSGRPLLLSFSNAYLGAFGSAARRDSGEWQVIDWQEALSRRPETVLAQIPFDQIGGFVFEPGGGGPGFVRFAPTELITEIVRRVRAQGGLLMVNEVTTGFGRTGRWFGYQHYGLQPDIVAMGKGLGNGYPISATLLSGDVAAELERGGLHHAQSHQNNPLGCAVALEVLRVFRKEAWVEQAAAKGDSFLEALRTLGGGRAAVKEVRGRGMLLALELAADASLDGAQLQAALWRRGLITSGYPAGHPAGTGIRLDPALPMQEPEVARLLEALEQILSGE